MPLAAVTLAHTPKKKSGHRFKHHPECQTLRCARHADELWSRLHQPKRPRWIGTKASSDSGWAIPEAIVMCESSGQNLPPNEAGAAGYYQIIPGTWAAYGGRPPDQANLHSKAEQDAVAARIWDHGNGASQWVCKA